MSRTPTSRMSCALTVDAVRERRKTVTRRHVDSWKDLRCGDRLTLIEKGMGLAKGEKQVVLAEVEVLRVTVEPIMFVNQVEIAAEGFDPNGWGDLAWSAWWARGHGYKIPTWRTGQPYPEWQRAASDAMRGVMCRRIEWRYLDDEPPNLGDLRRSIVDTAETDGDSLILHPD